MSSQKKKTEKAHKNASTTEVQNLVPQEETRVEGSQRVEQPPVEQPVEQPIEEAPVQEEKHEEQVVSEEKKSKDRKPERVIVILSSEDSAFLSRFSLPRSSVSRAVLRGTQEFLEQFIGREGVTEEEIVERLRFLLK